ncbi:putative ammonium transporter 2 [Saccoglossus kowalevskii]
MENATDSITTYETGTIEEVQDERGWDDATWILTSAFIIFTMQSGFGLLESGSVSKKNEVNIMVKNAIDVIFGGLSYWMFGYGISFGNDAGSNAFIGIGYFFVDDTDENMMGTLFSSFFFHTSFATTATTIVSGAMAERTKLESYILFSFLNTFVYALPTRWVWATSGWLNKLGAVDIAGAACVHLSGGVTGLVATLVLKPRTGRFEGKAIPPKMGMPTNAIFGMFMLWWGWLGFNCGSTYGITGGKWKLAARSAVTTITCSIGGGTVGIFLSYILKKRKFDILYLINGVLGSLVSGTAICALARPWEALLIGGIGGIISCLGGELIAKMKIDDPVGVVPVHAMCGLWSLIAVGLFVRIDRLEGVSRYNGLFYGGGLYMLGIQLLAGVVITVWTVATSYICLKILDLTLGLRMTLQEEILGADLVEHSLNGSYDKATGELRSVEGDLIEIVKSNGGAFYNDELKKLSDAVAMRMPREMFASVCTLGHGSGTYSNGEIIHIDNDFVPVTRDRHKLSVATISSLRRVTPIEDMSSIVSFRSTVTKNPTMESHPTRNSLTLVNKDVNTAEVTQGDPSILAIPVTTLPPLLLPDNNGETKTEQETKACVTEVVGTPGDTFGHTEN